ncbi:MAG: HRDC domain-containing protein [Ardenticatenaceae bacterium]|nr:HRDC domain-containing protein [Anaerolineales bacterium]MCB8923431.1 HRDC domain-containing protein [Ardenticatenaceae bacterium]MCB8991414.1 HRDC domain-containing protein [Ardenticatenaceae bacterium]MCB9003844.1 HRDC domain-containing protein [Ardenticatenaceae bacterium]
MRLPPHKFIATPHHWQQCLQALQKEPRLAIDLEANSMFAYRERVCLIQISIPGQDYIIDPEAHLDLGGLGAIVQDTAVQKVFHAAEYDLILLKRQYGWQANNLFDTMWAARILGYKQYGLANILGQLYGIKLDKRYQKSNWCRRPLSPAHLSYAQYDTHFLLRLRDNLAAELEKAGRVEEALETFVQQTAVTPHNHDFDPESFRNISGANELNSRQQAILRELHIFRDQIAQQRDRPLFKIFGDRTLVELAKAMPHTLADLKPIYGMSAGQVERYGEALLRVIRRGHNGPLPPPPKRHKRLPDEVITRYDKLHTWRKERAKKRGVESDVIVSREALWALAKANPQTQKELTAISEIGDWRQHTYGDEILALLK